MLTCGVPMPEGFDEYSMCQEVNGVGWFVPEEQMDDSPTELVMTTVGFEQNVEVRVPREHWPPDATMVGLAEAIDSSIREVKPCL